MTSSTLVAQNQASKTAYDCAAGRSVVFASTGLRSTDYLAVDILRRGSASARAKFVVALVRLGIPGFAYRLFAKIAPGTEIFMFARQFVPDEIIRETLKDKPETQIVILGAGLDTSGLRIGAERSTAGVETGRFFEVDLPAMQNEKRTLVEQIVRTRPGLVGSHINYVPCSFGENELGMALKNVGFNSALPSIWVWSGVVHYLTDEAVCATVASIRELSAAGSKLFFDFILREAYERPEEYEFAAVKKRFDAYGEVMSFGFRRGTEDVRNWLEVQGLTFVRSYTNLDMVELYENVSGRKALSHGTPWSNLCVANVSRDA